MGAAVSGSAGAFVIVQGNGFVGSAMASAPDGDRVAGLTVDGARAWAAKKARALGCGIDDRLSVCTTCRADLRKALDHLPHCSKAGGRP